MISFNSSFGKQGASSNGMLRVTCRESASKIVLKLEGRLVGPWVEELRKTVLLMGTIPLSLEVDIDGLTFVDEKGEQVLLWLSSMGAQFCGKNCFCSYLCERLTIPLLHEKEE